MQRIFPKSIFLNFLVSFIDPVIHFRQLVCFLREDIKIPTYKPQKVLCELTYFSPNHHMWPLT